ncbi:M14 family metallopeptidase [Mucilaginibacter sp. CSA2-8R]|uniref:succinylglutamate desuccinylase/aspartoacylase family protein n=1 Tax=Mucilaginibacter sp. CSA2-8R TaxID=3141542 RepID=UPI00315DB56A
MIQTKLIAPLLVLLCFSTLLNAQNKPFQFQQKAVRPGTKMSFSIPVTDGHNSTFIPVTVFNGKAPGKALGIVAGIHGFEYPPIVAAQQLAQSLDPAQMNGTLILVHMANVPAFLQRSVALNQMDGKNLNRSFPGKASGTITERMAYTIANQIIARCDYVIDAHSGEANNDLKPYAGYYNHTATPELSKKSRGFATALGFNYVIQFDNLPGVTEPSKYCSREAVVRGIPAADIECGRYGIAEPEMVNKVVTAYHNALNYLKITNGTLGKVTPLYVRNRTFINSNYDGFFYSRLKAGEFVKKGATLGYITNFFGNKIMDVQSPVDGIIMYMISTPPVNKTDELFSIGHLN